MHTWRKGGIETVNVEREIDGRILVKGHARANAGQHIVQLVLVLQPAQLARPKDQPAGSFHILSRLPVSGRADANLKEALLDHQA